MTAPRRVPALAVPVDARSAVTFLGYPNRSPLLAITTGRALLVTLTLPERLEAGHVEFARQLACRAMAYAVTGTALVRMALPGSWSPLANGTLMARRPGMPLDAQGPSVRETGSDLGSSWLERVTGIEPALSAWEADVLPLNYTRAHRSTPPMVGGSLAVLAQTSYRKG